MKGKQNKLRYIWDNLERYGMMLFFIMFFINVLSQIIARSVFNQPLKFTEEVSRYAFVWMVFLGMSYAIRYDAHIKVDVLVKHLPKNIQFMISVFFDLLTLAVFSWIVYTGIRYVIYTSTSDIYTLPINKGIVTSIVPITGILVILRCIGKIARDFRKYKECKE